MTTLGDWILLGLKFGHALPIIEGIELNKDLHLNHIMPNNEWDLMFVIQHARAEKLKEVNKDMTVCLTHMESVIGNIKNDYIKVPLEGQFRWN